MKLMRFAAACPLLLLMAACDSDAPPPAAEATEIPDELTSDPLSEVEAAEGLGTPLEERVATLGLINKRNSSSRDIELKPGESQRIDDVIVRLSTCERTPPWEDPPQTGAFVQVLVQERESVGSDLEWHRVFSGWLFKESPSINVVEHAIYDVWLKDCAMSFPGEEG